MSYKDPEKQKDAQRRSMAKARGVKPKDDVKPQSCETHVDVKPGVKPSGMDAHMRRSWDNVLAMYQADPEKVRRIVKPVCDLKDTVGGETRNAGDCTRWGCYGPAYSDVARILGC